MSFAAEDLDATFFDAINLFVDLDDERDMKGRDGPTGHANLFARDFRRHLIRGFELSVDVVFLLI